MYQVVQPTTSQLEVFYVDRSQSLFYFVSRDLTAKLASLNLGPFSHHESNQRDVSGIKSHAIGMDSDEISTSLVMITESRNMDAFVVSHEMPFMPGRHCWCLLSRTIWTLQF